MGKNILALMLCLALTLTAHAICEAPETTTYDGIFPRHEPLGRGVGAMPGRVVWAWEPDSVD